MCRSKPSEGDTTQATPDAKKNITCRTIILPAENIDAGELCATFQAPIAQDETDSWVEAMLAVSTNPHDVIQVPNEEIEPVMGWRDVEEAVPGEPSPESPSCEESDPSTECWQQGVDWKDVIQAELEALWRGSEDAIVVNTVWIGHVLTSLHSWIIDSGSTEHMCGDRTQFQTFRDVSERIETATDEVAYATGRGDVKLTLQHENGEVALLLTNVLYAPVESNLLSTTRLAKKYIEVHLRGFGRPSHIVVDEEVMGYADIKNDLYYGT